MGRSVCVCVLGYSNLPFRWFEYLKETKSVAAPVNLFNKVTAAGLLLATPGG